MQNLDVYFWIEDYEKVDSIPNFVKTYQYDREEKIEPDEWGKLVLEDITIRFFGKNG